MGKSLKADSTVVSRNGRNLRNCFSNFKETRASFMTKIVKKQIVDLKKMAGAGECSADRVGRIRKYPILSLAGH
jgi:hypothetical protein